MLALRGSTPPRSMRAMPSAPPRPAALLHRAAVLLLLFAAPLRAQALVPAGSINAAAANGPWLVLAPDDPAVRKFATAIRDRFFKGAEIATALPDDQELA